MQSSKAKQLEKKILDSVWGGASKNETTAILGPSGSSKTSLFNVLAGYAFRSRTGQMTVTADIRVNGVAVSPADPTIRKQIVYVEQNDLLGVATTPREAILFSAKLRLPASTSDEQLKQRVERMVLELGLTECADTIIGGELVAGISGGERKRTGIGVELVIEPSIVLLDEPTSGLDSFSALQLVKVLKKAANSGATILLSIHQPASDIFETFDRVILLNNGRVMYQGTTVGVDKFFEIRGHPLPPRYNPAVSAPFQLYCRVN